MKKIKWILLFIMVLLAVVFLFATCKKTNAYYPGANYDERVNITLSDTNSSILITYKPVPLSGQGENLFCISVDGSYSNDIIYFYMLYSADGSTLTYTMSERNAGTLLTGSLSVSSLQEIICYIGANDYNSLSIAIDFLTFDTTNNSVSYNHNISYYYTENTQIDVVYNTQYATNTGLYVAPQVGTSFTSQNYLYGNYNYFIIDMLDYSDTFTEAYSDIFDDYVRPDISSFKAYFNGYTAGYTAGYQVGYDEGYAAGQTAGYNSGYQVGYQDGLADNTTAYNHGYDDGYADGYRTGYDLGMTDGDAIGYQRGLAEGMAGATPVSKTVGVVSSIFAGVGTILAIELFPGFPLGLLILVPLFFAVLGLILWIWRRN